MTRNKRHYYQFCGIARTLDFVGERWTLLIVRDLLLGPKRYTDLLYGLEGLTTNLLARRLKDMEENGLIEKQKLPPPISAVVYQLTPLGLELEPMVLAACEWGTRLLTHPAEEDTFDLGWSLLRLKRLYKGGHHLVFELHAGNRVYHVALKPGHAQVREGVHPETELTIKGSPESIYQMFFGPAPASELPSRGELIIEGKFGRWPRLLAAFGLS